MRKFHFQDLRPGDRELRGELDAAFRKFIDSGQYVLGAEVAAFEHEYALYCGATHGVGVGSGLDALHLALRAVGIGLGDEVIVPANTYIATWLAVSHAGATPVAAEPDESSFNLCPKAAAAAITPRTRAVLAVNLYGHPCEYGRLSSLCRAAGIHFLVDNAQAQGARHEDRPVGGLADLECHSFYPSKNLGAFGEAGAVTTNRADRAETIRTLRNYGSSTRYHNEAKGFNARLDELQAALLRVKLRYLDLWNGQRRALAAQYRALLADAPGVRLPEVAPGATPVWHQFVIRHPARDELLQHLVGLGIPALIHYPIPPHLSPAYSDAGYAKGDFPLTERLADEVLSLPLRPDLPPDAIEVVAAAVRRFGEG